jgi:hypothetical protein
MAYYARTVEDMAVASATNFNFGVDYSGGVLSVCAITVAVRGYS